MAPEQGMQLSQRHGNPQTPQKPQQQTNMPQPEMGGNRPPLNYGQRPGGDATFPQDQGGGMGGAIRAGLDRNRSRR
jgi:hypothetical protein